MHIILFQYTSYKDTRIKTMEQSITKGTLPIYLYIPSHQEVQYYSEVAWNPKQLDNNSSQNAIWESPLSVQFKIEWVVPEFKTWVNISNLVLHISHLVWRIDVNAVENQVLSPTFENVPDYNPRRRALILSKQRQERIREIVWGDLSEAEGEIVYTSLGEEIFLKNTKWEMKPIGLSDNF